MKLKGSVTLLMSYLSIFSIAVLGSFADSSRISAARAMMTDDGLLAAQNILAEYEREILDDYHVLFVDSSELEGDKGAKEKADSYLKKMNEPLTAFSNDWMGTHMSFSEFNFNKGMTENNCQYFVKQAVAYAKYEGLVDAAKRITTSEASPAITIDGSKAYFLAENAISDTNSNENKKDLSEFNDDELIGEGNEATDEQKEKLKEIDKLKDDSDTSKNLSLSLLLPADATISGHEIEEVEWNVTSEGEKISGEFYDSLAMQAYIDHCYSDYMHPVDDKEHALMYEKEYIICGKKSDKANLTAVVDAIFGARLLKWIAYNKEKRGAEARTMALAIAAAFPEAAELEPAIEAAIIAAWSAVDARNDVVSLFKGEKIDLMPKNSAVEVGYSEVLDEMIAIHNIVSDKTAERCVRLIEQNMRVRYKPDFRADSCYSAITAEAEGKVEPRFFALPVITRMISKAPKDFTYKIPIEAELN
ncbi:MAG: DUF5702 domain-containing protein [Catonella sp.]|nr:DUF5702 domain-containing protein [Catonella sp.]